MLIFLFSVYSLPFRHGVFLADTVFLYGAELFSRRGFGLRGVYRSVMPVRCVAVLYGANVFFRMFLP